MKSWEKVEKQARKALSRGDTILIHEERMGSHIHHLGKLIDDWEWERQFEAIERAGWVFDRSASKIEWHSDGSCTPRSVFRRPAG